jgi:hypothetical protein
MKNKTTNAERILSSQKHATGWLKVFPVYNCNMAFEQIYDVSME